MALTMSPKTGLVSAEAVNGAGVGDGEKGHGSAIGKVLGELFGIDVLDHQHHGGHRSGQNAGLHRGNSHTVELYIDQYDGDDQGQQRDHKVGQMAVALLAKVIALFGNKMLTVLFGFAEPEVEIDDTGH